MTSQNPLARAKRKPGSLRCAVDAHCYMCMGGDESDLRTRKSVLTDIRWCTSLACPLAPVRGFIQSKSTGNRVYEEGAQQEKKKIAKAS